MELLIEENQNPYHHKGGINPFTDPIPFHIPELTKPKKPEPQQPPHYQPRQPFKQPSYHQKYQHTYKQSQQQPKPQPIQPIQQSKPAFSYDHILNSLNMQVNNGKLEYKKPISSLEQSKNKIINHYFQSQSSSSLYYPSSFNNESQSNPNPTSSPSQSPISREEYQRRLRLHYLKQHQQRRRIAEIKSTKMLYPGNHIQPSREPSTSLRSFLFR